MIGLENLLCFLVLLSEVYGQNDTVTRTFPVGLDGANPLVSAVAGTENVSLFCEVTRDGSDRQTQWTFITESNPMGTILTFTAEGGGQENFMVTSLSNFRRNFTILKFRSNLDNTQIGCGANQVILFRFDLKLISKFFFSSFSHSE